MMSPFKSINLSFMFLINIMMANFSIAKELNFDDLKWSTCPKTEKDFAEQIQKFDTQLSTYFAKKSYEELIKIFDSNTEESTYLRLFAPFLIEPSHKSHFDKNCWILFQDFTKSLSDKKSKKSETLREEWMACIEFNYRSEQKPAQDISECYKSYKKP